jgi:hypothetical protein
LLIFDAEKIYLEDSHIPKILKDRTHICSIEDLADDLRVGNFDCDIESNLKFAAAHSPEVMAKETIKVYKNYF